MIATSTSRIFCPEAELTAQRSSPVKLTHPLAGISVEYAVGTGPGDRLIPYLRPVGAEIEWLKLRRFGEATRKLRNQSQKSTSFG
jgi:hypothetical protein